MKIIIGLLLLCACGVHPAIDNKEHVYTQHMYVKATKEDTTYCEYTRLMWGYKADTIFFLLDGDHIFLKKQPKLNKNKKVKDLNIPEGTWICYRFKEYWGESEIWYVTFVKHDKNLGYAMIVGSFYPQLPVYFFSTSNICE